MASATIMQMRISRSMAAPLEATERKAATSMLAPSKTSGHQKCSGTAEILKPRPTMSRRAIDEEQARSAAIARDLGGDAGGAVELQRAVHAVEHRQAVDHDRAGGRAEEDVLERRLSAEAMRLAEARQHVARQARHLDGDEEHQQVASSRPSATCRGSAPSSSVKNSGPSPSCMVGAVVLNHIRMMPAMNSSSSTFQKTRIGSDEQHAAEGARRSARRR